MYGLAHSSSNLLMLRLLGTPSLTQTKHDIRESRRREKRSEAKIEAAHGNECDMKQF
jgi:hypothetical protein